MPKSRQQKSDTIDAMVDMIGRSRSIVFTNFAGLKVKEVTELRRKCRDEKIDYLVAKKTLMDRAFKTAKIAVEPKRFPSEVATVFSYEDEVAPARILMQYAKDHPAVKPFGGILEHAYVDAAKIAELSALPSKLELLSKVVGSIAAPMSGFVRVMAGNLRGLVQVLKSISEKKPAA